MDNENEQVPETEEKKKKVDKKKVIFWARLFGYIAFMIFVPATFLIIRFGLFQKINKIQIGGWGAVCILIVFFGFLKLMKEVKKGLPFCYLTQVLTGLIKIVMPLLAVTIIIFMLQNNIKEMLQVMYVLVPSEFIAVLINPLPQWEHDNKLDEEGRNLKTILQSAGLIKKEEKK